MWRLSCNKRVWYEWMAQAYICIPKAFSPSPVLAGGHAGGQRNASGNSDGPMDAAFQNAPLTPRFAEVGLGMPGHSAANPSLLAVAGEEMSRRPSSGSGQGGLRVDNTGGAGETVERLLVGMSALMNTGGRSSWVGM